jgi:hypothetical protein
MRLPGARRSRPRRAGLKQRKVRRLDPPDRFAVIPRTPCSRKVKPTPSRAISHRHHIHQLAAFRASRLRCRVRDGYGIAARPTTPAAARERHTARLPDAPIDQTVEPSTERRAPSKPAAGALLAELQPEVQAFSAFCTCVSLPFARDTGVFE